jgi:hypothetical protein
MDTASVRLEGMKESHAKRLQELLASHQQFLTAESARDNELDPVQRLAKEVFDATIDVADLEAALTEALERKRTQEERGDRDMRLLLHELERTKEALRAEENSDTG